VAKNLYQFKIQSLEDTDGIFEDKLQKGSTEHVTIRYSWNRKHWRKAWKRQTGACT